MWDLSVLALSGLVSTGTKRRGSRFSQLSSTMADAGTVGTEALRHVRTYVPPAKHQASHTTQQENVSVKNRVVRVKRVACNNSNELQQGWSGPKGETKRKSYLSHFTRFGLDEVAQNTNRSPIICVFVVAYSARSVATVGIANSQPLEVTPTESLSGRPIPQHEAHIRLRTSYFV